MARRKKHNPERRTWRGRSYRKGNKKTIRENRDEAARKADSKVTEA